MAGRNSAATERALARVSNKQSVSSSALAEGIDKSTLFRALARMRDGGATAANQSGRTLVVGAGALGRELSNWLRRSDCIAPVAFLDDGEGLNGAERMARGIVGRIDRANVGIDDVVMIAIADSKGREAVAQRLAGVTMQSYIDGAAIVNDAIMGAGCLLLPNSLLSDQVEIGRHVVLNTFASVGHECVVGDFCTLSSYVALCGRVRVGKRVFFGVGAKVVPDVTIGDDAVIGAGAVVLRDVAPGEKMFGVPAKAHG